MGGYCNFMHLKKSSRERQLFGRSHQRHCRSCSRSHSLHRNQNFDKGCSLVEWMLHVLYWFHERVPEICQWNVKSLLHDHIDKCCLTEDLPNEGSVGEDEALSKSIVD